LKCLRCGSISSDDSKSCKECGAPLGPSICDPFSRTETLGAEGRPKKKPVAVKYRIIGRLGEGGMGIVYKAEDTTLRRTVALKFLPPELTRDEEAKARFVREAQAAAALNHPHICTVYEIGESEGQTFISMEYIEGQSLKDRIASGPLEIEEAKGIALQIAEGLKEAHDQGIVHRDIKPANIMLTAKGQVKIMDFGLAKLSWGADLTRPSMIMGTAAYMSPEQARGEAVDRRTDIWSFGATLYEMFAGKLPFGRRAEQSLIYAILNEQPGPIHEARPEIPKAIGRTIMRCMEKDPASRFQNLGEVLEGLRTARSATCVPEPRKYLIVLPFENISPDPEQDYFCDGMTEEIITDLSHIQDLLVISRNSAMTYKGTKKKTDEIAAEAHVRYVLEGSVRKAGNSLRITAQLIDAETDTHLWAEKYSGNLNDVFDIQEKVSRSIADSLRLRLRDTDDRKISERPIANIQAYEFYLKARQELYRFSDVGLDQAVRYLENGLEIVGENALLISCLGIVYFQFWNLGIRIDEAYLCKAEECAERIFRIEPGSPHGRLVRGLLRSFVDPQRAIWEFKSVIADDLYNDEALLWLCICYVHLGKGDEADSFLERLLKIDFLNSIVKVVPALKLYYRGEFEAARDSLEKVYRTDTEYPLFLWQYGRMLASCGDIDKAVSAFEASAAKGLFGLSRMSHLFGLAFRGGRQDLLRSLRPDLERWARSDWMASFWLAECLALIGETEMALNWLESAVDLGFVNYPFICELDPFLINIRSEPRFQKLMERVKTEWEYFEV
jgi:serine/threonine protein kinase